MEPWFRHGGRNTGDRAAGSASSLPRRWEPLVPRFRPALHSRPDIDPEVLGRVLTYPSDRFGESAADGGTGRPLPLLAAAELIRQDWPARGTRAGPIGRDAGRESRLEEGAARFPAPPTWRRPGCPFRPLGRAGLLFRH